MTKASSKVTHRCPSCGAPPPSSTATGEPCPSCGAPLLALGASDARLGATRPFASRERASGPSDRQASLGRYPIRGQLGAGGMGEVLAVEDASIGRVLAAKVIRGTIDPARLAKFEREGRITGRLEHPCIPPVHELGTGADGRPYFTMKRIEGQDLAALLDAERQDGARPVSEAAWAPWLSIFTKVCDAIAYAHANGVIHRDLKPANIMVGAFGEVLVMDWGLARELAEEHDDASDTNADASADTGRTQEGQIVGTPAYMPPEQAAGELSRVGPHSDVYSLGALLYEILTLRPPFEGKSAWEVIAKVTDGALVAPRAAVPARAIPWELEAIVLRAMAREADARYASASALADDVHAYVAGRRVGAARYGLRAAVAKWATQHRAFLRAAAAVVVTALAFAGYIATQVVRDRAHRASEVAELRAAIDRADPVAIRARAAALVAVAVDACPDPARRMSPSPSEREAHASVLSSMRELTARQASLVALVPDDAAAREQLHVTLLAVGALASVAEEQVLAEHALDQAKALGVRPTEAEALLAEVRRARDARHANREARVLELLEQVRTGRLASLEAIDGARIEIASYRSRRTVAILIDGLRDVTARMREVTRATLLATATVTPDEARAGWTEIEGLEGSIDAWMAWSVPHGASPPARLPDLDRTRIARAMERLVLRDRGRDPASTRDARAIIAAQQELATVSRYASPAAWIKLVCECLGHLEDADGAIELAKYCWSEHDEVRAVPAGLALVRLRRRSPDASVLLDECAGLGAEDVERRVFDRNSSWWRQIVALMRELRDPDRDRAASARAPARTASELVERGMARHAEGDPEGAIADFTAAIGLDPTHALAYLGRGSSRSDRGDLDGAMADFDESVRLAPDRPDAYAIRGGVHFLRWDRARALADYDRAILLGCQAAAAWANRALVRLRQGDGDGALADFTEALRRDPNHVAAYLGRAEVAADRADYAGAMADLDRAIAIDGRYAVAFANRGATHALAGRPDRALDDYNHAIALDPRCAAAWCSRASLRLLGGDTDLASADVAQALALDPRMATAYVVRGSVHRRRGERALAIADYDRAIELGPSAEAYHNRGNAYWELGEHAKAIADYDEALRIAPRCAEVYASRGRTRAGRGELELALADLDRAIELEPRLAPAYTARGAVHREAGKLDLALTDLDRAIELEPDQCDSYVHRGIVRRLAGNQEGALADLDRAIGLDPRSRMAYVARGNVHEARGDFARAIADFDQALRLDPTHVAAWVNRGNARRAAHDVAEAIADFTEAIRLDPRCVDALVNRGVAYHATKDLDRAIADLDRAIEVAPRDATAYLNRGLVRQDRNDLDGAMTDLDAALRIRPRYGLAWVNRGCLRQVRGDDAGAIEDFDRAIEIEPARWNGHVARAQSLSRLGRIDEALASYRRGRPLAPASLHAALDKAIAELEDRR